MSESTGTLQITSALNGSSNLTINPYASNSAYLNPAARKRLEALEARRMGAPVANKVDKVQSITVEVDCIVMESHPFNSAGKTTYYATLLVIDPTSAYDGSEDIFQPRKGANGEVIPADVMISKEQGVLSLPIGTSKSLDEARQKWLEKGVVVAPCPTHYHITKNFMFQVKIATTSASELPIHQGLRATISAFGYLLGPDDEKRDENAGVPSAPGVSLRLHLSKPTSESNSPLLMSIYIQNPALMNLPVPTFQEARVLDTKLKDKSKAGNSASYVGSLTLSIPMLCQIEELELHIASLDKGTLARIDFQQSDKSPFVHKKVDNTQLLIGDIILTLDQWNGEQNYTDVVTFRLWREGLKLFGVSATSPWQNGLGEAMMRQTPTIYTGNINHTDSEAYMRAKTDDNIRSIIALNPLPPIMDVPFAIMNYYGIPVTKEFAREMSVCRPRPHSPQKAAPHPLFTIVEQSLFKENFYNSQDNPVMVVLNEMEYNARNYVFEGSTDWKFFVVVGNKIMMESDKALLQQLRELRDSPNYKGPLGEMLAFKQWNASAASKWRDVIYGATVKEAYATVPPDHPVIKANCNAMANNDYFYIFAISPSRYKAAVTKKQSVNPQKRLRDVATNHDDDNNVEENGGEAFDNQEKFRRFEE
jgi:hypothetical protein